MTEQNQGREYPDHDIKDLHADLWRLNYLDHPLKDLKWGLRIAVDVDGFQSWIFDMDEETELRGGEVLEVLHTLIRKELSGDGEDESAD